MIFAWRCMDHIGVFFCFLKGKDGQVGTSFLHLVGILWMRLHYIGTYGCGGENLHISSYHWV